MLHSITTERGIFVINAVTNDIIEFFSTNPDTYYGKMLLLFLFAILEALLL